MGKNRETELVYNCRLIRDLKDMLCQSAELFASKPAFRLKDSEGVYHDKNYSEFKNEVDALGTCLVAKGYKDGYIAVMSENRYEWCLTYMAAACGAGVIVPIDKELSREEIKNLLSRSGSSLLFTSDRYIQMANEIKEELPSLKLVVNMDASGAESNPSIMDFIRDGRSIIDAGNDEYLRMPVDRDALSVLLFTSGTTDLAKGVMLSHRNLCSNLMSVRSVVAVHDSDSILSILPLHHTYECTCGFLLIIYCGAAIAFNEGLKHIAKNMQEVRPTLALLVPLILESLYKKVIDSANKKLITRLMFKFLSPLSLFFRNAFGLNPGKHIFAKVHRNLGGRLRLVISGAAGIDPDVSRGLRSIGFNILQGYGLTECSPIATANRENRFEDSSIGLPIPYVDVKLADQGEDGIGEIIVRGDNVMLGYFKNREATEAVMKNGWLYTGDLGYMDSRGFFYISGRKKSVIVTKNGKNIFPEEVESYINKSRYVRESMVWGKYEDNIQENCVHAAIVPDMEMISEKLKTDGPSDDDVKQLIAAEIREINRILPVYKKIRSYKIQYEELEKTTTKKIKRHSAQ